MANGCRFYSRPPCTDSGTSRCGPCSRRSSRAACWARRSIAFNTHWIGRRPRPATPRPCTTATCPCGPTPAGTSTPRSVTCVRRGCSSFPRRSSRRRPRGKLARRGSRCAPTSRRGTSPPTDRFAAPHLRPGPVWRSCTDARRRVRDRNLDPETMFDLPTSIASGDRNGRGLDDDVASTARAPLSSVFPAVCREIPLRAVAPHVPFR